MYFRSSIRRNQATDEIDSYYRLVESYRDETGSVCHASTSLSNRRTLLNVDFFDELINADDLNQVRRIICKRYQDIKGGDELFDIQENNLQKVLDFADKLQKIKVVFTPAIKTNKDFINRNRRVRKYARWCKRAGGVIPRPTRFM
jgi:hypothetical protein